MARNLFKCNLKQHASHASHCRYIAFGLFLCFLFSVFGRALQQRGNELANCSDGFDIVSLRMLGRLPHCIFKGARWRSTQFQAPNIRVCVCMRASEAIAPQALGQCDFN